MGEKKNAHSSFITEISSLITHYFITHFVLPNNDEISHSACLAPKTQLCFQHKKLKNLGPTHINLTCAPKLLPDPINSTQPKYLTLPNHISSPFRLARLTPSMAFAQASPTCIDTPPAMLPISSSLLVARLDNARVWVWFFFVWWVGMTRVKDEDRKANQRRKVWKGRACENVRLEKKCVRCS